jgi:hypothetical protein
MAHRRPWYAVAAILLVAIAGTLITGAQALDCTCKENGGRSWCKRDKGCPPEPTSKARAPVPAGLRPTILETGYSLLSQLGKEEPGYGLYSYAISVSGSQRTGALLAEIFKAIPDVQDTAADRAQVNILYIPVKPEVAKEFAETATGLRADPLTLGGKYAERFYDYKMARALLNHVCNPPSDAMRELCAGDMSRGPYIFTYAHPASSLEPVPPPFLFVDLSDIDPKAFGEFISAFRAQVKRDDISDGARIGSLRLKILNIALMGAAWITPVQRAMSDIVHLSGGNK